MAIRSEPKFAGREAGLLQSGALPSELKRLLLVVLMTKREFFQYMMVGFDEW